MRSWETGHCWLQSSEDLGGDSLTVAGGFERLEDQPLSVEVESQHAPSQTEFPEEPTSNPQPCLTWGELGKPEQNNNQHKCFDSRIFLIIFLMTI